jgi:hypothetical protein
VQYLSDLRVYDAKNLSWHGVRARAHFKPLGVRRQLQQRREAARVAWKLKRWEQREAEAAGDLEGEMGEEAEKMEKMGEAEALRVWEKRRAEEEQREEQEEQQHRQPARMPEGRYGHIAAALDPHRMLVFGGRGVAGRVLNDTWVYHVEQDAWQLLQVRLVCG